MSPDEALLPSSIPEIPKFLRIRTVTKGLVSYVDSQNYSTFRRAAHAFVWAPWEGRSVFGVFRAAIMMQMRFDGTFGFPGGVIEEGEDVLEGLSREMEEEIGWDTSKNKVSWENYYCSYVNENSKFVFHTFIIKISLTDFKQLELNCHTSKDFGSEVLGSVRVPLYTMQNNYSGLPAFLNNRFVGGAKQQLLLAINHTKILDEAELEAALFKSQNMKLAASRI